MIPRRRVLASAATALAYATALALAAAACAGAPTTGEGASGTSGAPERSELSAASGEAARGGPPAVRPAGSGPTSDAAARVEEAGARHPDQFAGVAVAGATLEVYRRPGGGFDDDVRAVAGDVPLVFRDAPHTHRELAAVAARIQADAAYWTERGLPIWTVVARHDGTGVEVGTPAGDRFAAAARERYGDVPIIILRLDEQPATVPTTSR